MPPLESTGQLFRILESHNKMIIWKCRHGETARQQNRSLRGLDHTSHEEVGARNLVQSDGVSYGLN